MPAASAAAAAPTLGKKKKRKQPPCNAPEQHEQPLRSEDVPSAASVAAAAPKLGKRKQRELAEDPAECADAQPPEASAPGRGKKRKHAAGNADVAGGAATEASAGDAATIPEDERRKLQSQITKLVVRMRAEGKSEAEIKVAKDDLKRSVGRPIQKPDGHRARKAQAWKESMKEWKESEAGVAEWRENRQRVHDLVVIPVFWRGRHDQQDVLRAAEDIKALVAQHNVDVWVDQRRHYTPGQKYAHWEYRGVMLRVEVGPEDLKNGVCRVCLASVPGEYKTVQRKTVRLPPKGGRTLLVALKEFGLTKIEVERRKGDSDDEAEGGEQPASAQASAAASAGHAAQDEDLQGNWEPAAAAKQRKKAIR